MVEGQKRAGGRPPRGPKSGKGATLATRITAETRRALDAEAERTGRSVSQVVEIFLERAIAGSTYLDRLTSKPAMMAAVEKLVEIEAAVDAAVPDKQMAFWALFAAWDRALFTIVPLPPVSVNWERERQDTEAAWDACYAVLAALEEAGDTDPVFQRAMQPLRGSGGLLGETEVTSQLFRVLLRPNPNNAFAVLGAPPDQRVIGALEQLRSGGTTAGPQIKTALALVRRCIERTANEHGKRAEAMSLGRSIATAATRVDAPQLAMASPQ